MTTDPDPNPEDPQDELLDIDYDVSTVVSHLQGVANTGSGDQYNFFQQVEARRRAAHPQAVPEDHIAWLQSRFVRPGSFHLAEEKLVGSAATVLIAGPLGSGRQTAAQMLLCPLGSGHRSLHRLPTEPDDPTDAVLDDSQITPGDRLLLDLSEVDGELFNRHQQWLPSFRDTVQHSDARLVVVLPHNQEHWLSDELQPLRVTIGRPDPLRVLSKHLSAEQLLVSNHMLQSDELIRQLSIASMSQVSRLAGYIIQTARAPGAASDCSRWLAEALAALNNHAPVIVEALQKHCDAPARALLLSMAMLEGARVVAVDHAERELLRITQCPDAETPKLERDHLFDRIDSLDADVDVERRVRFRKLAYGSAVLTHFWDGYLDLRQQFAQWVQGLAELPQLTTGDRNHLADRFTGQSLRVGHIDDLLRVARVWARHRYQHVRLLAYTVLATAVIDVRFGGSVRRRLYLWAGDQRLNGELAQVIIALCVNVLAPNYPDRALVRLRLLARHFDPSVAGQARQALVALAAADDRFFRRLLAKLIEVTEFNAELFLELVDPQRLTDSSVPLIADQSVHEQVIYGWSKALLDHRHPTCIAAVHRWLQAYTDDPSRDVLLDVLVAAGKNGLDLFARLFEISRDWPNVPAEPDDQQRRRRTVSHLKCKINRARGFDRGYPRWRITAEEANQ